MNNQTPSPKTQKDQTESLARLLGSADHLKIHLGMVEAQGLTPGALPDLRQATKNLLHQIDSHGALLANRPAQGVTTPAHAEFQTRTGADQKRRL